MAKASPAITAFNAGEFAPEMQGRVDIEKYPIACYLQQNFISTKQGASAFRAGTAYVQPVKNSAQRTWIARFEFSQTQAFIIEFGGNYCRFFTNHGPELILISGVSGWSSLSIYQQQTVVSYAGIVYYAISGPNLNQNPSTSPLVWQPMESYAANPLYAIYETWSPYASVDLTDSQGRFALQIRQQGDVLYIAGGYAGSGYQPFTLTRYSNSPPQWTFAVYAPTDGPFTLQLPVVLNQNIALGVSAVQGNGITISAFGGNVFASTDVGRLVRIATQNFNVTPWATATAFGLGATCSNNGNNYFSIAGGTSGVSAPVHTSGSALDGLSAIRWLYTDSNYGIAQITAYTSPTQVTANVLLRFPASVVASAPIAVTAITQSNPCSVTAANPSWPIGSPVFLYGVGGMTQVNQNPYTNLTVSATFVELAGIDSTTWTAYGSGGNIVMGSSIEWQLGAWSNTTEWPRAVGLFKDRLFWGGKINLWGSVPGLYTSHAQDFFGQVTTDAAINVLISGLDASNICWIQDAIILLIGTEGGEYGLDSANYSASPLGPANVDCLPQSQWRCAHIGALKVGTSVLYAQRAGRKLFAMDYNFYLNRYDSTDQNKFAYHISTGGLVGLCYQAEPWSVIWSWREDGVFLSYTFNREDQVTAWCWHTMGNSGQVESMAVIPAPDGTRDEFWAIVNRTVNGSVIRTIEYGAKQFEGPRAGNAGDAQSSAWYVDCGVQFIAASTASITAMTMIYTGVSPIVFNVTAANNFTVGQQITISGVAYTGTADPNGTWTVQSATPTGFSFENVNVIFASFAYLSGGVAIPVIVTGSTTITGLPPVMRNQTVAIFASGGEQPQAVVSATGTLTINGNPSIVTIGFPYEGNLVPNRFEGGADVGTAQAKKKNGSQISVRLVDSCGGTLAQLSNTNAGTYQNPLGLQQQNTLSAEAIQYNLTQTALDAPPPFMSGDFPVSFPQQDISVQDQTDFFVLIQQQSPYPMTVVGLFPSYEVHEPR